MTERILLGEKQMHHTLLRLAYQVVENHRNMDESIIIGLQPRGVIVADRIAKGVSNILGRNVPFSFLDATFYRDDFRHHEGPIVPRASKLNESVENKRVILVDDVLYTGRSIRSGMEALMDFGRPSQIELLVLIDRRYSRELPLQPDYTGRVVDTIASEKIKVDWSENIGVDRVLLFRNDKND